MTRETALRAARRAARIGGRLAALATVVFVVTSLAFLALASLPGDPARALVGPQASPADVERARAVYALDRPASARYWAFWRRVVHRAPSASADAPGARSASGGSRASAASAASSASSASAASSGVGHSSCAAIGLGLHADLGRSFHHGRPVLALLGERLPRSLELGAFAVGAQLLFGLAVGVVAGARRGRLEGRAASAGVLVAMSAPTFVIGLALQHLFAYRLGLLPFDGYGKTPGEHLLSLLLPGLTLGVFGAALYARVVEAELSAALDGKHALAARARGSHGASHVVQHGLRLAAPPIATLAVLDLGALAGGAIVTEKLFRWPGLGQLAVDALVARDGPLILGTVLATSCLVALATLLLDSVSVLVDPRAG